MSAIHALLQQAGQMQLLDMLSTLLHITRNFEMCSRVSI